jgi:murein DD-endopeptidase MepM/ murein hydrolase activator NlpD
VDNITGTGWYGPTVEAYNNHQSGDPNNYDGYSQGWHGGLDFFAPAGSPVYGSMNQEGTVVRLKQTAHGWAVYVQYSDWVVVYQHLDNPLAIGETVTANTVIGTVWDWGNNSHVHIEIRDVSNAINDDGSIDWTSNEQMLHNPLEFMTSSQINFLMINFDLPYPDEFFGNGSESEDPLDYMQILRVGGCVIWKGNCFPGGR